MFLYNISVIIEENSHEELIQWIKNNWLTQLSQEMHFLKMLHSPHEGHTYCIQMKVQSEDEIQDFINNNLQLLQEHIAIHHNEKAFIFDSIMQYLEN